MTLMGICGSHFLHTTFARFKRNAGKLSRSETATLRPWCRKSIYQTLPEILRCALIRLIVRFFYSRCSFFYRYFLFFVFSILPQIRTRLASYSVDPFDLSIVNQTGCPKEGEAGWNIHIDPDTFSTRNIANAFRKAGEAIGDGFEAAVNAGKKVHLF